MIRYLRGTSSGALKGIALLRLDFNTEDTWRMEAALPTIRLLLKQAKAVVILSHRGRPEGVSIRNGEPHGGDTGKLSLKNDAASLGDFLRKDIVFIPHFRFKEIKGAVEAAPKGSIFLLENIRFLHGESTPRPELAKKLSGLGDYYVNDAFSVCHHPSDSVSGIEKFLPSYGGLVLEKEINSLTGILDKPKHPFVVILGGGKAHDKLEMIQKIKEKTDWFLLGGAPANTIMMLRGQNVDGSLLDDNPKDRKVLLPLAKSNKVLVPVDEAKKGERILDIGPKTIREYVRIIKNAKTILWAGPVGFIEDKKFAKGNLAIARAVAANRKAFSVTGGGETVMFLKKHKLDKKFSFISTGGGAMLEFLAGKKLPGIEALRK